MVIGPGVVVVVVVVVDVVDVVDFVVVVKLRTVEGQVNLILHEYTNNSLNNTKVQTNQIEIAILQFSQLVNARINIALYLAVLCRCPGRQNDRLRPFGFVGSLSDDTCRMPR